MAGGAHPRGRGRGQALVRPPPPPPPPSGVAQPRPPGPRPPRGAARPQAPMPQGQFSLPQNQFQLPQGQFQQQQPQFQTPRYQPNQLQGPFSQNFASQQFVPMQQQFQQNQRSFQSQQRSVQNQRGVQFQGVVSSEPIDSQPPPASPAPIEQVMDPRYFKLVCFNCGDPGHFVGNCIQPKLCFICNMSEHPSHLCTSWEGAHPSASYFGSANRGLGFYHIEAPSEDETKWLNFKNCAVVNIRKGDISGPELEKNLNSIFCKHKKWPWQIRKLDEKNFLVRFPAWKSMEELFEFPAFDMETEGVNVKILPWDGDCPSLAELPVVWMKVKGIPPKMNAWKTYAQAVTCVGVLMDVDWSSVFKSLYAEVRLQIACRDPVKVPKERVVEIEQKFYLLHFDVEGVEQVDGDDGPDDPGEEIPHDGGFDPLEDEQETLNLMESERIQQSSVANGGGNDSHRSHTVIPDCWEDLELDNERLILSGECMSCGLPEGDKDDISPRSLKSLPAKMNYDLVDDDVWEHDVADYNEVDSEALSSLQNSVSAAYCSQVLDDFTAVDSVEDDSGDDRSVGSQDDMEVLPQEAIDKFGSVRKSLFPILDVLVSSSEKKVDAPSKPRKWGPVVATKRMNTRYHGDKNVLEKAKEYQKRKNLEIPQCFKGAKLARCQGNSASCISSDKKLASAVFGQTFKSPGCQSVAVGSSPWRITPDSMDMKALLMGLAGKDLSSEEAEARVDSWRREIACEKLLSGVRIKMRQFQ